MSLHFTHPAELTPEVTEACTRLADAGIPLGSQTVLLKGINDNVETLKTAVSRPAEAARAALLPLSVRPDHRLVAFPHDASRRGSRSCRACAAIPPAMPCRPIVVDAPGGGGKIPLAARLCAGPRRRRPDPAELRGQDLSLHRPGRHGGSGSDGKRRKPLMRIALVYDLRDDYRALGFSEEEIAEFDNIDTIDQLDGALRALGCEVGARRPRSGACRRGSPPASAWTSCSPLRRALRGARARRRCLRSASCSTSLICSLIRSPAQSPRQGRGQAAGARCRRADAGLHGCDFRCQRARRLERVSCLRQADRGRDRQRLRVCLGGEHIARSLPPRRRSCSRATASRCWSRPICPAASSPSASSATARMRPCSASARSCSKRMPRPISTQCIIKSFARSWWSTNAPTTTEARLAGERALAAYHALECRDAARIDFRSNAAAEPYFLEANPLAGLHPHHSDLPILAAQNGVPYIELIGMILDAGLARYGLARSSTERSRRRA